MDPTQTNFSCGSSLFYNRIVIEQSMSLTGMLDVVYDFGAERIDLYYEFLEGKPEPAVDSFRQDLENREMSCPLLLINSNLCHPDDDVRAREVVRVADCLRLAGAVECEAVRIVAGPECSEEDRAAGIDRVVTAVEELSAAATEHGVTLVLENVLQEFGWEEPHFALKSPVFLAIWERVRKQGVKVLFNTASFLYSKDGGAWVLRVVSPHLFGVRLMDRSAPESDQQMELGHGCLKLPELFRYLKHGGFAGLMSVDYAGQNGVPGLRRSFDYARQVWSAVKKG